MAGLFTTGAAGSGNMHHAYSAERRPLSMSRVFAGSDAFGSAEWPPRTFAHDALGAAQRRGHHSLSLHHWSQEHEIQRLETEARCRRRELEWNMPRVAAEIDQLRVNHELSLQRSSNGNQHAAVAAKEEERMDRLESALRRLEDFASNSSAGAGSAASSQTASLPAAATSPPQRQRAAAITEEHGRALEGQLSALRQRIEETKQSRGVPPVSEDESITFIASVQRYQALELKWRLLEKQVGEARQMGLGEQLLSSLDNLLSLATVELQQLRELIESPAPASRSPEAAAVQMDMNADGAAGHARAQAPAVRERGAAGHAHAQAPAVREREMPVESARPALPEVIHDSAQVVAITQGASAEASSGHPQSVPVASSPGREESQLQQELERQIRELRADDSEQKREFQRQLREFRADADAKRSQIRQLEQEQRSLKEQLHGAMVEAGANDARLLHANERLKKSEAREQSLVEKLVSASSLAASAAAKRSAQVQALQAQLAQAEGELMVLRTQQLEAEAEAELAAAAPPPLVEKIVAVSDNAVQCDFGATAIFAAMPSELEQVSENLRSVRERLLSAPSTPQQPLSPQSSFVAEHFEQPPPQTVENAASSEDVAEAEATNKLEASREEDRLDEALMSSKLADLGGGGLDNAGEDADRSAGAAGECPTESHAEELQEAMPSPCPEAAPSCAVDPPEDCVAANAEARSGYFRDAKERGLQMCTEEETSTCRDDAATANLDRLGTPMKSSVESSDAGSPTSPQSVSDAVEPGGAIETEPHLPIPDHVHVRSTFNERSSSPVCCGDGLLGITARRRKFFEGRQQKSPERPRKRQEQAETSLSPQHSRGSPSANIASAISPASVPETEAAPDTPNRVTEDALTPINCQRLCVVLEQSVTSGRLAAVLNEIHGQSSASLPEAREEPEENGVSPQAALSPDTKDVQGSVGDPPLETPQMQNLGLDADNQTIEEFAEVAADAAVSPSRASPSRASPSRASPSRAKVTPGAQLAGRKYNGGSLKLRHYERAVRTAERRHGRDHMQVALPLELLAEQYKQRECLDEHSAALERVLRIRLSSAERQESNEGSSSASEDSADADAAAGAAASIADGGDVGSDAPQVDCGVEEPAWQSMEDLSEGSDIHDAAGAQDDAPPAEDTALAKSAAAEGDAALDADVAAAEALREVSNCTSPGDSGCPADPEQSSTAFRISSTPNRGLPCAFSDRDEDSSDAAAGQDSGFNPFAPPAQLEAWLSPTHRRPSKKAFASPPRRDSSPPPDLESDRGTSRRPFSPPPDEEHEAGRRPPRRALSPRGNESEQGVAPWSDTAAANTTEELQGWGTNSGTGPWLDNTSADLSGEQQAWGDENVKWPADGASSSPGFGNSDVPWPAGSPFAPGSEQSWGTPATASGTTDTAGWSADPAFGDEAMQWPSAGSQLTVSDEAWGTKQASGSNVGQDVWSSGVVSGGDGNLWPANSPPSTDTDQSWATQAELNANASVSSASALGNSDAQWPPVTPTDKGRDGEQHVQSAQPPSTSSGSWAEDSIWPATSDGNSDTVPWPVSGNWAESAAWPAEAPGEQPLVAGWPAAKSAVTTDANWAGEAWAEVASLWS